MAEIFKDIQGFEGLYQISNFGKVKSLLNGKEKILKQKRNSKGYLSVALRKDNKIYYRKTHRLVGEAFVSNINNLPEIDHINTIRDDNRAENLRWVTHKENCNNPLSILNYIRGNRLKKLKH